MGYKVVDTQTEWEDDTQNTTLSIIGGALEAGFATIDDFNGQTDGSSPDNWTIINSGEYFEIDTGIAYEGDASLLFRGDTGSSNHAEGYIDLGSYSSPSRFKFLFRTNYESRSNNDGRKLSLNDENGNHIIPVNFSTNDGDNDIDFEAGDSGEYSIGSTQTWYEVYVYNVDYNDDTFDCEVLETNGSSVLSLTNLNFSTIATAPISRIYVKSKGWGTSATRVDDIRASGEPGTWTSTVWDTNDGEANDISTFNVDANITDNSVNARITSFDNAGSQIDQTNWFSINDGNNSYPVSLNAGFKYQVEFDINSTDVVDSYTIGTTELDIYGEASLDEVYDIGGVYDETLDVNEYDMAPLDETYDVGGVYAEQLNLAYNDEAPLDEIYDIGGVYTVTLGEYEYDMATLDETYDIGGVYTEVYSTSSSDDIGLDEVYDIGGAYSEVLGVGVGTDFSLDEKYDVVGKKAEPTDTHNDGAIGNTEIYIDTDNNIYEMVIRVYSFYDINDYQFELTEHVQDLLDMDLVSPNMYEITNCGYEVWYPQNYYNDQIPFWIRVDLERGWNEFRLQMGNPNKTDNRVDTFIRHYWPGHVVGDSGWNEYDVIREEKWIGEGIAEPIDLRFLYAIDTMQWNNYWPQKYKLYFYIWWESTQNYVWNKIDEWTISNPQYHNADLDFNAFDKYDKKSYHYNASDNRMLCGIRLEAMTDGGTYSLDTHTADIRIMKDRIQETPNITDVECMYPGNVVRTTDGVLQSNAFETMMTKQG